MGSEVFTATLSVDCSGAPSPSPGAPWPSFRSLLTSPVFSFSRPGVPALLDPSSSSIVNSGSNSAGSGPLPATPLSAVSNNFARACLLEGESVRADDRTAEFDRDGDPEVTFCLACSSAMRESIAPFKRYDFHQQRPSWRNECHGKRTWNMMMATESRRKSHNHPAYPQDRPEHTQSPFTLTVDAEQVITVGKVQRKDGQRCSLCNGRP